MIAPVWNLCHSATTVYAGLQNGSIMSFDLELETAESTLKQNTEHLSVKFGQIHKLDNQLVLFGESDKMVQIFRYSTDLSFISKPPMKINRYYRSAVSGDRVLVHDAKENSFIVITNEKELKYEIKVQGNVRSITALGENWLVYTDSESLYKLSFCGNLEEKLLCDNFVVPPGKHRWITAAVESDNRLVVGTASGHIVLFEDGKIFPSQKSVHGTHGVTFVTSTTSTGRNGLVATWDWESLRLGVPRKTTRSGLEWPITVKDDRTVGFQADKFKMFENGQEIFTSNCGGGHRSCDFWTDETNAYLCFIKKGNILLEKAALKKRHVFGGSGHGGHINHVIATDSGLVTCSEDTKIIVNNQKSKQVFDIHDTAQRCLAYSEKLLACGGAKEVISLHNLQDNRLLAVYDPNVEKYKSDKKSVQSKKRKREVDVSSDRKKSNKVFYNFFKF